MNSVPDLIQAEIRGIGPISFARFMELALYAPTLGYYEREEQIGCRGDFYTSVSAGPLFGQLLAFQFAEWLQPFCTFDKPDTQEDGFCLVEAGAHDGRLASDILAALETHHPQLYQYVEYRIIEPSALRRKWQEKTLSRFSPRVRWFDSLQSDGPVRGIIFCNELLDAMPIQRFAWDCGSQSWREWLVDFDGARFFWRKAQQGFAASVLTPHLSDDLLAVLPADFTFERSKPAEDWWKDAATSLVAGKLLTFDYGFTDDEFFQPERSNGTVRAYARHHVTDDILANPGGQDVTAHVNFSIIQHVGELVGLKTEGFMSQAKFLTGILEKTLQSPSQFGDWGGQRTRQFQTLTHPEHLGRAFRVLVQSR